MAPLLNYENKKGKGVVHLLCESKEGRHTAFIKNVTGVERVRRSHFPRSAIHRQFILMSEKPVSNEEIDLRGVICPYNFVKTKLKLDAMLPGQILMVLLDDGDPIRNVPQSVENEGHAILTQESLGATHRVWIQKSEE